MKDIYIKVELPDEYKWHFVTISYSEDGLSFPEYELIDLPDLLRNAWTNGCNTHGSLELLERAREQYINDVLNAPSPLDSDKPKTTKP